MSEKIYTEYKSQQKYTIKWMLCLAYKWVLNANEYVFYENKHIHKNHRIVYLYKFVNNLDKNLIHV